MYWILGFVCLIALLVLRQRFSPRSRICKVVAAAHQAADRNDIAAFEKHLEQANQMAEVLKDQNLRQEFRGDLALMSVTGAYQFGDLARAKQAAARAIDVLKSIDPSDKNGKMTMVYGWVGDILLDEDQPAQAAESFRTAAGLAEQGGVPIAAIFPLQKLSDALLEDHKRDDAAAVIERCVQIEKAHFAEKLTGGQANIISMTAPDQNLLRGDFAAAEQLLYEKVRYFESNPTTNDSIDLLRYQLHLAEAQFAQGKAQEGTQTLTAASTAVVRRFGPTHPRVARIGRKLERLQNFSGTK